MTFRVRPARNDEGKLLVSFNAAMAAESEDKGLDTTTLNRGIEHLFAHPEDGRYLVAETESGEVAGALMLTYEWSDWRNGRFWWIQSVYVLPRWRRSGVYRALHEHVQTAAEHDPQACGLRLYVEKQNHGAQATYLAMGMAETHYQLWEVDFNDSPD